MNLRLVTAADQPEILVVEARSTPNLHYLGAVYADWLRDPGGEFMLVEEAGQVLGCAKYTRLPDGSAWLEALRVSPQAQGRGLGKRMYGRFFELARAQGVPTMRMYTGIRNAVSKGLAEHFGFQVEETFLGYSRPVSDFVLVDPPEFQVVTDAVRATELLLEAGQRWGEFVVMNRTFYKLTPELCAFLAGQGMVYAAGPNVLVLGARFSPELALHLGLFAGDPQACFAFAASVARERGSQQLICLFPHHHKATQEALEGAEFRPDRGEYIVMKVGVA